MTARTHPYFVKKIAGAVLLAYLICDRTFHVLFCAVYIFANQWEFFRVFPGYKEFLFHKMGKKYVLDANLKRPISSMSTKMNHTGTSKAREWPEDESFFANKI